LGAEKAALLVKTRCFIVMAVIGTAIAPSYLQGGVEALTGLFFLTARK